MNDCNFCGFELDENRRCINAIKGGFINRPDEWNCAFEFPILDLKEAK